MQWKQKQQLSAKRHEIKLLKLPLKLSCELTANKKYATLVNNFPPWPTLRSGSVYTYRV